MNRKFILIAFTLGSLNVSAQKPEPISRQVVYNFSHVYDTSLKDKPLQEKHQLLVGTTSSHYIKGTYVPKTMPAMEQSASSGPMKVVTAIPIAMVTDPFVTAINVFQFPAQQKLATVERIGIKEFLLETKLPVIDWKVNSATKEILGYQCQQATGRFGGRTYTAWFTADIPVQYGPWKLNGLPGLILEASDDKQEVSFIATAINKGGEGQLTDYESSSYITATEAAVTRAKKAYDENPVAAMQAQLSPGSAAPRLMFRDIAGKSHSGAEAEALIEKRTADKRKGLYNPLELEK